MSTDHKIVSRKEWIEARKQLLAQEKQFTRQRDELSAARRALPWVRITERYEFERARGKATSAELFDGKSSSSCITSCSALTGTQGASHARSGPTTSTASS